jgi:hypothetical protein
VVLRHQPRTSAHSDLPGPTPIAFAQPCTCARAGYQPIRLDPKYPTSHSVRITTGILFMKSKLKSADVEGEDLT